MSRAGIIEVLTAQGGAASRRQLKEAGFSQRTVEEMVRRGELRSVRRDAVILSALVKEATPWEVRALEARAVGLSLAPVVTAGPPLPAVLAGPRGGSAVHALSHESALMIHGLPYFGEDGLVHLVRTDGRRGRRDRAVWVHRPIDAEWVVEVDGLRVVKPTLAALQMAATHGAEAGLVALDGVLHQARCRDRDESGNEDGPATAEVRRQITAALALTWGSGSADVTLVAELADAGAESAGESRSRWLLRRLGFGPMTTQFPVREGHDLVGLADLKLNRWDVLIEFDGTGKYSASERLLAEKDREDRIRALGYQVVRIRWAQLDRPHLVRQRVLAAIALAEAHAAASV